MKHLFFNFFLFGLSVFNLFGQGNFCTNPGFVKVKVFIKPDLNSNVQTFWEIVSSAGDTLKKGTSNSDSICVPANQCIRFTIHDRGENGLCCTNGIGYYRLFYDDVLVRGAYKFRGIETTNMGCSGCVSTAGTKRLRIYINTDQYPEETSWSLTNNNNDTLAKGKDRGDTVCVPNNTCLKFTVLDRYGDGFCCNFGQGGYQVFADTGLVLEGSSFGFREERLMGCEPGFDCSSAIPVTINDTLTATYDNHWYKYVADSTGSYAISTCSLSNNCQTKIWVYDYCIGLTPTENNAGTIAYSAGGCGPNAYLPVVLIKNKTYYIRIGDSDNNCPGNINWSFRFLGPVVGCTDPNSCTYNPVATVNDPAACLYSPNPNCPDQPDLMVDSDLLKTSFVYDSLTNNNACFVQEGCLKGYGKRYLIKFSTRIENIGAADYYIGRPPTDRNRQYESWIWDPCHNHWHYKGYAEYVLFDKNSNAIPAGFKAGFCVMDLNCSQGGGTPKYNCGRQGITAGCGDIYSNGLSCQWVDITDVDTGRYTLVVRVNWDNSPDTLGRIESDKFNNWGQLCVHIKKNSSGRRFVSIIPNCINYVDCNGEVFGSAKRDCKGVCQGTAIKGDFNTDSILNNADLIALTNGIKDSTLSFTACRDLFGDQSINIADIQMLGQCLLETADTNLISKPACRFENAIVNSSNTAKIRIDSVNLSQGYADLSMENPTDDVVAFQLRLSGLSIDSIKTIGLADSGIVSLNFNTNGLVFGNIFKNHFSRSISPKPFLRVYFDSSQGNQVCISKIHAIMNRSLELIGKQAGPCKSIGNITFVAQAKGKSGLRLIPNPFSTSTKLYFPNSDNLSYTLIMRDVNGKIVQQQDNLKGSEVEVQRSGLPTGLYFFQLVGKESYSGKMIIE